VKISAKLGNTELVSKALELYHFLQAYPTYHYKEDTLQELVSKMSLEEQIAFAKGMGD